MSTPKKRAKKEVIDASEGKSLSELSKQFDLPKPSIQNIMQNKEAVLRAINKGSQLKRARLKKAKYEDLEEALLRWCEMVRSQNNPLTGHLIVENALQLAENLNIEDFKASDGWLAKFKHRHSINLVGDSRRRRLEQVAIGGAQNLAEIAEEVIEAGMEVADKQSKTNMVEIEEEQKEKLPSFTPREAKDALRIIQRYVKQNISDPNVLRSCDNIEEALAKESLKKMK